MAEKRFYWLKLHRDFFKQNEIRIIEGMENGKDYVLFYLKLLVESIDHDGMLKFSDTIPFNDTMLARITETNIDIVRSAVKIFRELGMMELLDDGTLYMNQVQKLTGSETGAAERMRRMRNNVTAELQSGDAPVTEEKELEKEIEIEDARAGARDPAPLPLIDPESAELMQSWKENKIRVDATTPTIINSWRVSLDKRVLIHAMEQAKGKTGGYFDKICRRLFEDGITTGDKLPVNKGELWAAAKEEWARVEKLCRDQGVGGGFLTAKQHEQAVAALDQRTRDICNDIGWTRIANEAGAGQVFLERYVEAAQKPSPSVPLPHQEREAIGQNK